MRRFWTFARAGRRHVLVIAACQLLAIPLAVLSPRLVMTLVDRAGSATRDELMRYAAILVAMSGASVALGMATGRALTLLHQMTQHALRWRLFRHVQRLSVTYHEAKETGYAMARQTDDAEHLEGIMPDALVRAVIEIVKAAAFLFMLFSVEWRLATFGLLLVIAIFGLQALLAAPARRRSDAVRERHAELKESLHQALTGHRLTVAAAAERREGQRFLRRLNAAVRAGVRRDLFHVLTDHVLFLITGVAPVLIILGGAFLITDGSFSVGGLFAFFMYLAQMAGSVAEVARKNPAFQGSLASWRRVAEILDERPDVVNPVHAFDPVPGDLVFRNVTHRYPNQDRDALHGIDLVVPEGRLVALVGPSGAGKSTLAQLVPRFFDPTSGVLTVAGTDLRELDLEAWRRSVGFVPQDVFLFDRSIAENIAFGAPLATKEDILRAADAAHVTEFLAELPNGIDTVIGERGTRLSGGQRQRIAIARELLRDPKILVLDEATSALDSRSERAIQAALDRLLDGRTALVIAHRLSTVRAAHRIVVLDRGRLVEEGTHEELLGRPGLYRDLYEAQVFRSRTEATDAECIP